MICKRCGHELVVSCSTIGPLATTTHEHTTLQCIANLCADLAKARQEIETIDAFRAAPWSEIRKLLGDDDSPDEAIAGAVCATILTHRALAANKREAEDERARSWELAQQWLDDKEAMDRICADHETEYGMAEIYIADLETQKREAEERAARAEAEVAAMRALIRRTVAEVDPPLGAGRCITGSTIAALRAFRDSDDAGRDLLTAVRRLYEVVRSALEGDWITHWPKRKALQDAFADPALTILQGTHEEVPHENANRKRD